MPSKINIYQPIDKWDLNDRSKIWKHYWKAVKNGNIHLATQVLHYIESTESKEYAS